MKISIDFLKEKGKKRFDILSYEEFSENEALIEDLQDLIDSLERKKNFIETFENELIKKKK